MTLVVSVLVTVVVAFLVGSAVNGLLQDAAFRLLNLP